ncbi:MAG: thermonuclease family protein, partial [Halobacteria archaeon]|nr:thermonuclease family protein [Halobacteria archaeon]
KATTYAESKVEGKTVQLEFDANEGRRGYYDRLLTYVYVNGSLLNRELVEKGYARVYDSSFVLREEFEHVEGEAQSQKAGLWDCRTSR